MFDNKEKVTYVTLKKHVSAKSVSFTPGIPQPKTPPIVIPEIDQIINSPEYRCEVAINADDAGALREINKRSVDTAQLVHLAVMCRSANALAVLLEEGASPHSAESALCEAVEASHLKYFQPDDTQTAHQKHVAYEQGLINIADLLMVAKVLDNEAIQRVAKHIALDAGYGEERSRLERHLVGIVKGDVPPPTVESLAEKHVYYYPDPHAREAANEVARQKFAAEEQARRENGIVECEGMMYAHDYGPGAPSLKPSQVQAEGRVSSPDKAAVAEVS